MKAIRQPERDLERRHPLRFLFYPTFCCTFDTEVIVASVRHPLHVLEAALLGADIATIPFNVITKMMAHPLTDKGLKTFLDDWEKMSKD